MQNLILVLTILFSSAAVCDAIAFDAEHRGFRFGTRRSVDEEVVELSEKKPYKLGSSSAMKKEPKKEVEEVKFKGDDFERAEKSIFDAMERAEKAVEHAIEDEVDCLFHEMPHDDEDTKKTNLVSDKKCRPKREHHFSDEMVECLHDCMSGEFE